VVRVATLPTELFRVAESLAAAGAELAIHPGQRLLHARFDAGAVPDRAAVLDALAGPASVRIEHAPASFKRGRDVFGAGAAEVQLTRALKARFDPHGVLAPGRAAGAT
jgi:FAD/FMN-containing dehydrogenase